MKACSKSVKVVCEDHLKIARTVFEDILHVFADDPDVSRWSRGEFLCENSTDTRPTHFVEPSGAVHAFIKAISKRVLQGMLKALNLKNQQLMLGCPPRA
jgi:hypothetical protein